MKGIALALVGLLPLPAPAQVPQDACFLLQRAPGNGAGDPGHLIAALAIEFRPLTEGDRAAKGPWRHLRIAARLADQGRGDGLDGALLTATADCRMPSTACFSDNDTSRLDLEVIDSETILVRTSGFAIAEYGEGTGIADLAPHPGLEARYRLTRHDAEPCIPE